MTTMLVFLCKYMNLLKSTWISLEAESVDWKGIQL